MPLLGYLSNLGQDRPPELQVLAVRSIAHFPDSWIVPRREALISGKITDAHLTQHSHVVQVSALSKDISTAVFRMAGYCRDCFTGTVETDGTHSGTEQELHGRPTYVSTPSASAGIEPLGTIVIIPDAFGWTFPNTRSLADSYARRVPCTVLLPDFMNGESVPFPT